MKKKILVALMSLVMVASVAAPVYAQGVESTFRQTQYYGSMLCQRVCTQVTTNRNALTVENAFAYSNVASLQYLGSTTTSVPKKATATTSTYSGFIAYETASKWEIWYRAY